MTDSAMGVLPQIWKEIRGAAVPGLEPEVVDRILRENFCGKRSAVRTCKLLDVSVEGKKGTFKGMVVDISRTGVLLRIQDPAFARADERKHLMPYTARVWQNFGEGLFVTSEDKALEACADVVRVTGYCGRGAELILIGCRFRHDLSEEDCEKLGIEYAEDRPPGLD
jgi:hypothetical protein